jgi:hypothetical protein
VLKRDCGYYSAFYLGARCAKVPWQPRSRAVRAVTQVTPGAFEGPAGRATCGPGSRPETGLQGEVPNADRDSGRSSQGYTCNVEVVGHYAGEGSTWSAAYYDHCAYYATLNNGLERQRGVIVVDVADPAHPRFSTALTSLAMLSPHESLKVNARRGLLGAVTGDALTMTGAFDVYDVKGDCAHPRLLGSTFNALGHEGGWAPDGRTYYASGGASFLNAIDVTDPTSPRPVATVLPVSLIHGLGVSADGNRLYLAHVNPDFLPEIFFEAWPDGLTDRNGLGIYDVSEVQARKPNPTVRLVGELRWRDGSTGQHALPVRKDGQPYVVFVDESGYGGPRIIDVSDEAHPRTVSKVRLEIQMAANRARAEASTFGFTRDGRGAIAPFGYNSHYCNVDRTEDPRVLVCANDESGIRIFDVRDFQRPREVAYFNPGGDGHRAPASFAGATSSFTVTQPRVLPNGEIWITDQDRGFYVLRVTSGAWPSDPVSRCLPAGTRLGKRGVGPLRIDAPLDPALPVLRRTPYSARYCVEGSRGDVRTVLSRPGPKGRVVLVASTVPSHALGSVRVGTAVRTVARRFPSRIRLGPGLYRTTPESTQLVGVRNGRVGFLAVAARALLRDGARLGRAVRQAQL